MNTSFNFNANQTHHLGLYLMHSGVQTKDGVGKNRLTVVGSGSAQTGPDGVAGHAAGTFNDANYFTAAAGLRSSMAGLTNWMIELWVTKSANAGSEVLLSGQDGTTFWLDWYQDGKIYFVKPGGNVVSSVISPITNWYRVLILNNPSGTKMYVNGVLAASGATYTFPTLSTLFIGRFWATAPADLSYISAVQFVKSSNLKDLKKVY